MNIFGALSVSVLLAAAGAAQEGWRLVDTGTGNDGVVSAYFVDSYSVVRSGDTVRFRTSTIFNSTTDDRDWDRSITTREGSCAAKASTILSNDYYSGSELLEHNSDPGERRAHSVGSMMHGAMSMVCGDEAYASPVVADPVATAHAEFAKLGG
ncbi:surface-adhesin E family protein [Sphingopyxis sp.]|uniref:surface-adhesin E family protein n=1 Tax=Sphingopyxis sp. TaxID=1908224 RepID=UPI003BABF8AB